MDFRSDISDVVTASDASTTGGGVTASVGLSPEGAVASACKVRGDIVEPADLPSVLTVGLFDGIGALRVAADSLGWNVAGHISVEKGVEGAHVVESRFPQSIHVDTVEEVSLSMVKEWSQLFTQVSLVVVGAGPPCQGVSGLNAARKGALRDSRSACTKNQESGGSMFSLGPSSRPYGECSINGCRRWKGHVWFFRCSSCVHRCGRRFIGAQA